MNPNLIFMLSIAQIILAIALFGSFIYNLFAKNKSWGFTISLFFIFMMFQIFESEVYEDAMYDQVYDDLYDNQLQQQLEDDIMGDLYSDDLGMGAYENYYPPSQNQEEQDSESEEESKTVSSVSDGDTIKLSTGETIRLVGLNAPENGQSCSSEATAKLKEFVLGKEVTLEQDVDNKDQYSRLLRYVYVDDTFVNLEMVRLGLAHKYEYGSNTRYSSQFEQAEDEAKQNEGCLWKSEEVSYILDECIQITNLHFNAAGDDNYNLNDEYVTFENKCSYSISMDSWTIKDETASHIYTIPSFAFQSGVTFTLYTGTGTNTNSALYWGRTSEDYAAIWNNGGDTLFLRDSNGNLVLSQSYS
jgi:micrococcal nuclease